MKKALCFFLAIVFVACVVGYGSSERFSLIVMIENLTNFEDMPTIEDITDIWTSDYYYKEGVLFLPYWVTYYPFAGVLTTMSYEVPLALTEDGKVDDSFDYEWTVIEIPSNMTTSGWTQMTSIKGNDGTVYMCPVDSDGNHRWPVVTDFREAYNDYTGDSEILNFFGTIKAFFIRLWNTVELIVQMIISVFSNLKYLLPWNSTVPRG